MIVPEPALEPDALNVQFSTALLVLRVHGFGLYVNDAVGVAGTLVDVVDVELVDVVVDNIVLVVVVIVVVVDGPGPVVVVVVVVEIGTVEVVVGAGTPTATIVDAAAALVPQALRLRNRTK